MSKFIELTTELVDKKQQDMGIDPELIPARVFIKKESIIAARDYHDDEGINGSMVYLVGGTDFFCKEELSLIMSQL